MDESQAIARLKRGDIGGLELLVHRYQVPATRAAYLITRDRATSEDIVQTAFVRVYERIEQFDPARPFAPWFLRAVVNDAVKSASRRERHLTLEDRTGEEISLPDPAPTPVDLAEAGETREIVWAALGQLIPAERAVIVMRYYLDLGESEMADQLDAPLGTIKWRLHTAKARLRELLRPLWSARRRPGGSLGDRTHRLGRGRAICPAGFETRHTLPVRKEAEQ